MFGKNSQFAAAMACVSVLKFISWSSVFCFYFSTSCIREPCMEDQRIVPQTWAQIRSGYECCSPGHEIGNLKDRDYFIWEVSLHFASDVNNKWVEHIASDVCLYRISFSNQQYSSGD